MSARTLSNSDQYFRASFSLYNVMS